ncbi:SDR family oxidoreductase [Rhodococcus opacus]|nr:SDR family oxidoreductase [Rhodococcus opacus]
MAVGNSVEHAVRQNVRPQSPDHRLTSATPARPRRERASGTTRHERSDAQPCPHTVLCCTPKLTPTGSANRCIRANVEGVLLCAQAAAAQMQALGKPGSIVLMSSMGGVRGTAFTVAYSTSKGAIANMARALADGLGPSGIRVNAVCPGVIDTHLIRTTPDMTVAADAFVERTPLRRLGTPDEVADAVVYLGSDLSSFVTGETHMVDGGLTAVI